MRYRCPNGHELNIPDEGTFVALCVVDATGPEQVATNYNYCMHCFGAWAVGQFPIAEVVADVGTILDAG